MNSKTLTTAESARELGVSGARIRQLAAAGELKGEKRGRDWMIDAESVERRREKMKKTNYSCYLRNEQARGP